MANNDIVVALDIGTTKICAIAGRRDQFGKLEILGIGKVVSSGVLRGVVSNIEKTVNAISEAIALVETTTSLEINVVHVGIAGQHIRSVPHRGLLTRQNTQEEISAEDVEKLIRDMHKLVLPPGDKIIHVIPQEFTVDSEHGIMDPVGMSGSRLEANFHVITGQITAINNICKCVEKAELELASLTLEPLASSRAVLSKEEMEAGVALVDIGGGTTDLAIFHEGIIRHTAVIPFGGDIITKDIKDVFGILPPQAEKLKLRFGSAWQAPSAQLRTIEVPGLRGREPKEIAEEQLIQVIQARVEEIFDQIYWEIKRSGYDTRLIGGIVLTGGGAMLRNICDLVEQRTNISTRLGVPTEHLAHGYDREITMPMYATAIGLILTGFEEQPKGINVVENESSYENRLQYQQGSNPIQPKAPRHEEVKKQSFFQKIFQKTKNWFETDPDADLK